MASGGIPMMRWLLALAVLAWAPDAVLAAAPNTLLIHGTIVAQPRIFQNGWLTIQGNQITAVSDQRPNLPDARVIDTNDIVFPGFVDLHNHPIYAVFPRWKAPRVFANRYQWRGEPAYLSSIQTPEGKHINHHFFHLDAH